MSSFYDDASLVVIPSGYKTSKVYAEKPTDGSGDLAFTRTGDTATRVASNGLIERVRTNLLLQSQTFDNASWTKTSAGTGSNPVVTANNGTAPDGTTTADKVVFVATDNTGISELAQSSTKNGTYAGSIYIKAFAAGDVGKIIGFRFASGTYALITLTADWQRFLVSQTGSLGTFDLTLRPSQGTSTGTVSVYIWGAQLETGDIATAYIPTTTAAVSVGPVANVPRLDYTGSTCPRLLLEPQRTNLLQFSEQFNNAYWSLSGATITSNTTVAPDGTQSADTLTGVSGNFRVFRVVSGLSNIDYSFSVFVKQGTSNTVKLDFVNVSDGPIFNFTTKTFTTVSGFTTRFEQHANGWFRLFATRVSNTTSAGLGINVAGAGQTVFIWGAQMEAGSYGTSYIPTLAASATRGADLASKSGISSLIGQTNGTAQMTFVMDFDTSGDSTTMLGIHAGTSTSNRIQLTSRFGTVRLLVIANNSIVTNDLLYDAAPNEVVNVAFKYGSAGVTAYVNGTQRYTTASAVVFTETMTLFTIGNRSGIDDYGKGQRVSQSLLFNSALTNAQLAELTTL